MGKKDSIQIMQIVRSSYCLTKARLNKLIYIELQLSFQFIAPNKNSNQLALHKHLNFD